MKKIQYIIIHKNTTPKTAEITKSIQETTRHTPKTSPWTLYRTLQRDKFFQNEYVEIYRVER